MQTLERDKLSPGAPVEIPQGRLDKTNHLTLGDITWQRVAGGKIAARWGIHKHCNFP